MKTIGDLLAEHPFFTPLPDGDVATIAGCGTNVHFQAGHIVAREGEPADAFYIIRRGIVAVETFVPGKGGQVIQTLHEGDIAGWNWIFPPYLWSFDLRVVEDVSMVALDGKCLRGKCEADNRLGYALMKQFAHILVERINASRLQALDLYR